MTTVIALHNQNLLDIAIQEYGSAQAVFDLAVTSDKSLTEPLEIANSLSIEDSAYLDRDILNFYRHKNLKPATSLTDIQWEALFPQGIGYWGIGADFIIN